MICIKFCLSFAKFLETQFTPLLGCLDGISFGVQAGFFYYNLTVQSKRSMATQNDSTFRQEQSTIRPPFFYGIEYPFGKLR